MAVDKKNIKDRKSVAEVVYSTVSDKMKVSEDKLHEDSHFVDDIGADSLDVVEFIMELETIFDIEISDDEMQKTTIIKEVIDYIVEKLDIKE